MLKTMGDQSVQVLPVVINQSTVWNARGEYERYGSATFKVSLWMLQIRIAHTLLWHFKIMKEEVVMTLGEHASKSISLAKCWFLFPSFVKACWNRENWSSLNPFFRDLFFIQLSCQITQILRRFSCITEHYLIVNIVTVTYFVVNLRWFLISFVSDHELEMKMVKTKLGWIQFAIYSILKYNNFFTL